MKFILALALLTIVVAVNAAGIPDVHKEKAKEIVAECRKENEISDEDFEKLKNGQLTEPSKNAKCFAKCFQEKAGIVKDGKFQEEAVKSKFSESFGEEKTLAVIAACSGEKGEDDCDTSFKVHQCFKKNDAY